MKSSTYLIATIALVVASTLFAGCSTPGVANARTAGVENRQDRIDSRETARQERWRIRAEREDARANARFDAM